MREEETRVPGQNPSIGLKLTETCLRTMIVEVEGKLDYNS